MASLYKLIRVTKFLNYNPTLQRRFIRHTALVRNILATSSKGRQQTYQCMKMCVRQLPTTHFRYNNDWWILKVFWPFPLALYGWYGRRLWSRWNSRTRYMIKKAFGHAVACLITLIVVHVLTHLERTPVNGRIRYKVISRRFEKLIRQSVHPCSTKPILRETDARVDRAAWILKEILSCNQEVIDAVREVEWDLIVAEGEADNASSLWDGRVCVYTGLLNAVTNDHELAFVIGHEVAHIILDHQMEDQTYRDVMKAVVTSYDIFGYLLIADYRLAILLGEVRAFISELVSTWFHVDHEYESDYVGMQLATWAGYDPLQMLDIWLLHQKNSGLIDVLSTGYPSGTDRYQYLHRQLSTLLKIKRKATCKAEIPAPRTDQESFRKARMELDELDDFATYKRELHETLV